MSWSINFTGSSTKVIEDLTKHESILDGQSKVEYSDALPILVALVKQNFADGVEVNIRLTASGHGYAADGTQKQRYLSVSLNS